jgi:hypothetical protein
MPEVLAQYSFRTEGKCGEDVKWSHDGYTLVISNVNKKGETVSMDNYNVDQNVAPWIKKKLDIRKVQIQSGIENIGSCAFANCQSLQEVQFEGNDIKTIGWGAFLNCNHLRTISLPVMLRNIETIAFANCSSLPSTSIPDHCRVGDQAFASCANLKSIEVAPTANLGHLVFASEVNINGKTHHTLYNGELRRLPSYVTTTNCREFGISKETVENMMTWKKNDINYDENTSAIDEEIPVTGNSRQNTYALIIGNQNYRFTSNVPYAIHDARVFAEYCKKTLGIPVENVHVAEDATKQMILEEAMEDWVARIPERENKQLIVYYAGHGVPDIKNKNKAYILPTDVRGTNPKRGISLDDFYARLGEFAFERTSVFLDACFSGVNRNNESVTEGLRGVEIEAEDPTFSDGNVIVFSAAQGNETAQGYRDEGHGLFTYFLLKEIRDTRGSVNYGNLSDHLRDNVYRQALQMSLQKKQTPDTNYSESMKDRWRSLSF